MEWYLLIVGIIFIVEPGLCQILPSECYALDTNYLVEIPVSLYGENDRGFPNADAPTECRKYCHSPEKALYYGLKRNGKGSTTKCYCADTLPEATTTGCGYTCGTPCGGDNQISVYQVCPTNCRDNECELTDSTCIGCINGFYGDFCDQTCRQNCASDRCQQTSGVCDGCDDGYSGDSCEQTCPENCASDRCEQSSGMCIGCDGDFYGSKCNITCPTNCEGQCDQSTGNCPACQTGWHGDRCDKQCPSNCLNHVCDQNDATCTHGCVDGWYGSLCNRLCPLTCKEKCERDSGDCTNGCDDGFYGTRCDMICSTNCDSLKCDQSNGSCTHGCVDMWYGDSCMEPCPTNCEDECDRNSGDCSSGCVDGFYGDRCDMDCPIQCETSSCKQENGSCSDGCTSGYHGDRCDDICPADCAELSCTSGGLCEGGCKQGWYGPRCTEVCPADCKELSCTSGGLCDRGCKPGWYGPSCTEACPANCVSLSCGKETGACIDGCQEGWTGSVCALSQTGVLSVGGKVGVSISVVAVLGVAIAVSVFFLRKKRQRASKQPDNHIPFTDVTASPTAASFTSEPIYENGAVEDTNVDKLLHYLKHRAPGIFQAEFKELQGNNALGIPARTEASIAKYQTKGRCYLMMSLPATRETLLWLIRENNCDIVVTLLTAQQAQNAPYLVTVKDDKSGDYEKLSTHKPCIKTDFMIIKAPPGLGSGSPEYANIIPDNKNQVGVFSITMEENVECLDPKSTIEVSKEIHAWCQRQRIVKPCILILCFDGVRYSGQFVAMCGLFEAINGSKNVDVLRCVKQLKSIRHGFIGSLEQYLNLYEACREYIERETNTYAAIQH